MYLVEVNNSKQRKLFLELPISIYKNDNQWIRPLDKDIEKDFDPKLNKLFARKRKDIRSNTINNDNQHIDKIAAFLKPRYEVKSPFGGVGFFECINDVLAEIFMFDEAKNWLSAHGMETMDRPIYCLEREH